MDEFRAYGGTFTEFSHRFASWLGLHSTDATALMEITAAEEKGTPLSPARLGERISLTSGATTALLNRLEKAGHIVRTRENADRRVVTLHSSAHVQDLADEFFGPLAVRLDAMMAKYPARTAQSIRGISRRPSLDDERTPRAGQPLNKERRSTPESRAGVLCAGDGYLPSLACRSSRTRPAPVGPRPREQVSSLTSVARPSLTASMLAHSGPATTVVWPVSAGFP